MNNIKTKVYQRLKEYSLAFEESDSNLYTTSFLAKELDASRNVVSQYLNEYYDDGMLIKVNERPILFFTRDICEHGEELMNSYTSYDALKKDVHKLNKKSMAFTKLIGYKGSLSSIVQQCKSAITYPNGGLPILLLGPTGVGKSLIANTMYEYGVEKGIFQEQGRCITVNCSEYADNPEFFLTNLFGCKKGAYTGADKDREGLISLANGGMLFLDEVHCLSRECQEKLFLFMDKGIYHMVGDNDKWYEAHEHLVFATTENPQTALLKTLYRRIPIVTQIPSLSERPKQEKQELMVYLLEKEAHRIHREIKITQRLCQIIEHLEFPENIGQFMNCIRVLVANAYVANQEGSLLLDIQYLNDERIEQCNREGLFVQYGDTASISLQDLKLNQKRELKLYAFNRDIITICEEYQEDVDLLLHRCSRRFQQYMDAICFEEDTASSVKELLYYSVLENICAKLGKKYAITFSNNALINLAKLYNDYIVNTSSCDSLLQTHSDQIEKSIAKFTEIIPDIVAMTSDFATQTKSLLNFEMNPLMFLDAILYLKELSTRIIERETRCIILAHGYSTASSLATTANYMVEDDVFDAMDMPMDVNVKTIAEKLSDYITTRKKMRDLIILVDMGSLEDIYKRVVLNDHINIVIMNNVTIKLALKVGMMVKQNIPVERIMESVQKQDYSSKAVFIENRKKEKAILTVCATGIATAEKISHLLLESLPVKSELKVLEYSFDSLAHGGKNAAIFDKYDVQFIIGTLDPQVNGVPFLSIEDIIEKQNMHRIEQLMQQVLSPKELEVFSSNIIRNFSLQNLLDYLTILNPKKIIGYVEEIINSIQHDLDLQMSGNTIVGLYLHISCLIERLIMDKYITRYDDLDQFIQTQPDFIRIVKKAFHNLERHYCVEIPVSEIAYIYDYIYRLKSVEKKDRSVEDSLF